MAHGHDHHDGDTYYLDQICMIALGAAFGGICLGLYFWNTPMLRLLLAPQFDPFLLLSGIALLSLAAVRSVVLWQAAGAPAGHTHDHDHHHHDHGHEHHADCGHDHHVQADAPAHRPEGITANPGLTVLPAAAAHDHDHGHEHGHDHDHAWAPWRYVVLLVPVMLFLLGVPSRLPGVGGQAAVDPTREAASAASLVGMGPNPVILAAMVTQAMDDPVARGVPIYGIDFKALEALAFDTSRREEFDGKIVQVVGQYAPQNPHLFQLARFRMQCCSADAVQVSVPIISREPVGAFKRNDWIKVVGRVEFREQPGRGGLMTVLNVSRSGHVSRTAPEVNPYIQ